MLLNLVCQRIVSVKVEGEDGGNRGNSGGVLGLEAHGITLESVYLQLFLLHNVNLEQGN